MFSLKSGSLCTRIGNQPINLLNKNVLIFFSNKKVDCMLSNVSSVKFSTSSSYRDRRSFRKNKYSSPCGY